MTRAEKQHLDRVAGLGCLVCAEFGQPGIPAEIHHIREGQGASQWSSHYLAVPLCHSCHRGTTGVHGDRSLLRILKWTELDLLAETVRRLQA